MIIDLMGMYSTLKYVDNLARVSDRRVNDIIDGSNVILNAKGGEAGFLSRKLNDYYLSTKNRSFLLSHLDEYLFQYVTNFVNNEDVKLDLNGLKGNFIPNLNLTEKFKDFQTSLRIQGQELNPSLSSTLREYEQKFHAKWNELKNKLYYIEKN